MERLCRIQLLGSLCVWQSRQRVIYLGANNPGALLGYLAYHRQQAHLREVLIAQFWPEAEERLGRESLSGALSALRKQFKAMGAPAEEILLTDNFTVQINSALVSTDVEEFQTHLAAVAQADTLRERAHRLQQALRVYQGPLLPGFYEDWIEPEQQQLEDAAYEAVRRLTACLLELGERDQALHYARRAVVMEPFREEAHLTVMQICAALGRPSAALRQYETLKRLLRREEQGSPGSAVQAFARQIRSLSASASSASKQSSALALPDAPPAVPAGTLALLAMERPAALKAAGMWKDARILILPEEWQAVLEQEVALYHGYLVHSLEQEVIAVFGTVEESFACALGCQSQWLSLAAIAGSEQSVFRMALTTRAVSRTAELYHSRLLRSVVGLLRATPPGCLLCSEAAAALLRMELPLGALLQEMGVYQLPGCAESERLYAYAWSGRLPTGLSLEIPPDTPETAVVTIEKRVPDKPPA